MRTDHEARTWAIDIESFARAKDLFARTQNLTIKTLLHKRMTLIRKRWPNHIRFAEIPQL